MKKIIAITTALMLLLGLLAGCQDTGTTTPITLEAVSAVTMNINAKQIVSDSDEALNGAALDQAVATVIGNMIQNGELTEEDNTVLITVGDAQLQQTVLNYAAQAFEAQSFAGAAVCAESKAQLVSALTAANNTYNAAELESLSMTQLALLCESNQDALQGVAITGTASQAAYVGEETVLDVVLMSAELEEDAVQDLKVLLDFNAGLMFYDVTYTHAGTAYEAYIDAQSGALMYSGIVGGERTDDDEEEAFTEENAIAAACISIGADVAAVKDVKCEFNDASAQPFFDVSFTYQGQQYNILISAASGKPLEGDVAPVDPTEDVFTEDTIHIEETADETIADNEPTDLPEDIEG